MSNRAQLNQIIKLQVQGTRQVSNEIRGVTNAINNLTKSFNRSSQSQTKHQKQTKTSQQGLANIQAGLVQLSTWLLNANVKLSNYFASIQKGFADTETASIQLKNAMGLAGASTDQLNASGFIDFQNKVEEVALRTQFTAKEVYKAFEALTTSGRTKEEAQAMLEPVLKLATASAGAIDLNEAIQIGIKSVTALDTEAKDMEKTLNKVFRTTQRSSVGIADMAGGLDSLRTSFMGFGKTKGISKEAELLGLLGLVKGGGSYGSAKEAAQQVKSFADQLSNLVMLANEKSLLNRKGKGRINKKKRSLMTLFGFGEGTKFALNKVAKKEMQRLFGESYRSKSKESFVESMFLDEKGEKLGASTVVSNILKAFSVMKKNLGSGLAISVLQKALGGKGAKTTITALMGGLTKKLISEGADRTKITVKTVIGKLDSFLKDIDKVDSDLNKAEGEFLKSLQGRLNLLSGAEDKLSRTIFKHDIYANAVLDTYRETVIAANTLMDKNEGLASSISFIGRMMQFLTGVGTTLGFTLTAMATFSIALTHSLKNTKGAVKGLGGTMRAFSTMFLTPTLTVMMQMIGGLGILGISVVALMRYFSGAEGIGEGFKIVLEKIGDVARATGGIIQLAFSSLSGKKSLEQLTDQFFSLRESIISTDSEIATLSNVKNRTAAQEKALNSLTMQSNRYSAELRKINDELGLEGRGALVKMELEGSQETVSMIARVTDHIKNLAKGIAVIGESAIQPVMLTLGIVFDTLYHTLDLLLMPVRAIATLFGFVSDEGSFMTWVLKGIGTVLGVIISGFLLSGAWKIFAATLTGLKNKFMAVGTGLNDLTNRHAKYKSRLEKTKNGIQKTNHLHNNQLSILDKLRLGYYHLTGQTKKYGEAANQIGKRNAKLGDTFSKASNLAVNTGTAIIGLGGAMYALGELTGSSAVASMAELAMQLGTVVAILPTLLTLGGGLLNFIKMFTLANIKLAAVTFKAWLPLLIVFGILYGLYRLFSDSKPELPVPKLPKTTASLAPTKSILTSTSNPLGTPSTTSSVSPFVGNDNTMVSSNMPPNTVNNNNQQVYNIKEINVNAKNPQEFTNKLQKVANKKTGIPMSGTSGNLFGNG